MTFLPLPARSGPAADIRPTGTQTKGNRGLLYNKFVNGWDVLSPDFDFPAKAKAEWIKGFVGRTDGKAAEQAAARLALLAKARGGMAETLLTTASFVTGIGLAHPVENGFLWHHTLGLPYLPGSSVKGLLRRWVTDWADVSGNNDPEEIRQTVATLFGPETGESEGQGALIVFDALPTGPVDLILEVLTPHDGGWRLESNRLPSDWVDPVPINFLAVAPGTAFQFALAPVDGRNGEMVEEAFGHLREALDWLGAGAKTASGFGRFRTSDEMKKDQLALKARESERANAAQKREQEQKVEAKRMEQEAKAAWRPKVGEFVDYLGDRYVVSELVSETDFHATLPDGRGRVLTDTSECRPWPAP